MKNRFAQALGALVIASLLAGCQEQQPVEKTPGESSPQPTPVTAADPSEAPLPVNVMTVGQSDVTLKGHYTGEVLAANEVEIHSRIEGYLQDFSFREGSTVVRGQVLFSIDPRPFQAQVEVAEAKVADARSSLKFAQEKVNWKKARANQAQAEAHLANQQREVERYKPLVARNIIPQQLYDQTVSARDVAAAQLDAAKAEVENTSIRDNASIEGAQANLDAALANLKAAQVNLDYTTISSPITGTIGELNTYPGSLIAPGGSVLATISSTDPMYVEFSINEADYLALVRAYESGTQTEDRHFTLTLADGTEYDKTGEFSMLDRSVDSATGTIKIRLEYDNPGGVLKPGQYVKVNLNRANAPNSLLVPQRAVLELQSSHYVWLLRSDDTVERREIEVGQRFENSYIVTSGLQNGDRVVTDGMARLKPGARVTVTAGATE
ncbi:MAG: efflux RND transporter periplasmic adaptor subunit [Vulcanimicrobiota bacterium]